MAHKNYKNINLLGTSHIARQSLNEVSSSFETLKPDIVTLELEKDRLRGVLSGKREKPSLKDILRIGLRSYLFAKFAAWVEEKLGSTVGVKPGSEMKLAYELAVQNKVRVVLIDQNIQITLKRLISGITLREKFRFVFERYS